MNVCMSVWRFRLNLLQLLQNFCWARPLTRILAPGLGQDMVTWGRNFSKKCTVLVHLCNGRGVSTCLQCFFPGPALALSFQRALGIASLGRLTNVMSLKIRSVTTNRTQRNTMKKIVHIFLVHSVNHAASVRSSHYFMLGDSSTGSKFERPVLWGDSMPANLPPCLVTSVCALEQA